MNKSLLFFALFLLIVFFGNAQSDYSDYLNKAMEKVEVGDCDAAQRFYNVYKELTGNTSSWVEKAIKDCVDKSKPKTYNIGDDAEDFIGYSGFKIAYLDASGKHGFAISFLEDDNGGVGICPSIDELMLMWRNRHSLGLNGEYWSSTRVPGSGSAFTMYKNYTYDFTEGVKRERRVMGREKFKVLFIERF